jgi:hypothetical protein
LIYEFWFPIHLDERIRDNQTRSNRVPSEHAEVPFHVGSA